MRFYHHNLDNNKQRIVSLYMPVYITTNAIHVMRGKVIYMSSNPVMALLTIDCGVHVIYNCEHRVHDVTSHA
jgi:hypothetical protein